MHSELNALIVIVGPSSRANEKKKKQINMENLKLPSMFDVRLQLKRYNKRMMSEETKKKHTKVYSPQLELCSIYLAYGTVGSEFSFSVRSNGTDLEKKYLYVAFAL